MSYFLLLSIVFVFTPKAQAVYYSNESASLNSDSLYNQEKSNPALASILAQNNLDALSENSLSAEGILINQEEEASSFFSESGSYLSGPGVSADANRERTEVVEHEVKEGDTVGSISIDFDISIDTILSANNLKEDDYIHQGDKLKILPKSGVMHKVKSGQSLSTIAQIYDISVEEIEQENNLTSDRININDELFIPGANLPSFIDQSSYSSQKNYIANQSSAGQASVFSNALGFIWPALYKKINSGFGYRKWGNYTEFHKGVDIEGNTGDPAKASQAGKIVFVGWKSGYGNTIMVSHNNGLTTLYAHLSKYQRTSGYVEQGEIIGNIGSTGRSTGSHLHFEIRSQGKAVNPLQYIK